MIVSLKSKTLSKTTLMTEVPFHVYSLYHELVREKVFRTIVYGLCLLAVSCVIIGNKISILSNNISLSNLGSIILFALDMVILFFFLKSISSRMPKALLLTNFILYDEGCQLEKMLESVYSGPGVSNAGLHDVSMLYKVCQLKEGASQMSDEGEYILDIVEYVDENVNANRFKLKLNKNNIGG